LTAGEVVTPPHLQTFEGAAMVELRALVPVRLFIAVIVLLISGAAAGPIIRSVVAPEQLVRNILLVGLPFILIFAAIVLTFIGIIAIASRAANEKLSEEAFRKVEMLFIGGIVIGVISMYQPWLFAAYRYGFTLLLVSTLGFILWSHIVPKRARRQKRAASFKEAGLEPDIPELDTGKEPSTLT
jgi:hypothetical protein